MNRSDSHVPPKLRKQTDDLVLVSRSMGLVVIVLAGIVPALGLMGWWAGRPRPIWGSLTSSVGIGLGGLALMVGFQRRPRLCLALFGASLALSALSIGLLWAFGHL
jgi:hypothetical protein